MPKIIIEKSCDLVIYGASGDLAKLKIFPAIYALAEQNRLPKTFRIIGYARSSKTTKQFQKEFHQSLKAKFGKDLNLEIVKKLLPNVFYFQGEYDNIQDHQNLLKFRNNLCTSTKEAKNTTCISYLSVPPTTFHSLIENIGKTKPKNEDHRLVIEKPFGENFKSAEKLFHHLLHYFTEDKIYLLDHYLGKSAVQSIFHLRHSNYILNLLLQGKNIANIQITVAEDIGIKNRGKYFDQVGTIKDMFQSHLLQILALTTMSLPLSKDHKSLQREKFAILSATKFTPKKPNLIIGQYQGYKQELGIAKNSATETFCAIKLEIDQEAWHQIPIYLRTGKALQKKHSYIAIEFKKSPFQAKNEAPNLLILDLQPEEKISINLLNKYGVQSQNAKISTTDSLECLGEDCLPEHALLLLDVTRNRRLYFLSINEILATWAITDKILNFIKQKKLLPEKYQFASSGPESQNQLPKQDGFKWN